MDVVLDSNIQQERFLRTEMDFCAFLKNNAACLQSGVLRVFGYGSLLWNPDIEFNSYMVGYVENYERRFNQGNETFRGTKERPGRVANLEERQGGKVWGISYEVRGKMAILKALRKLYHREIAGGSYKVTTAEFHPRKCTGSNSDKCCTLNYHNVPLPHEPCGLSQTCQSQNIESLNHHSSEISSRTLSPKPMPSIPMSDSSSRHVDFENDCPCSIQEDSNHSNLLQTCKFPHHSYNISDKSNTSSEHTVEILNRRKISLDSVNHTKQIVHDVSRDHHDVPLDSHFSTKHEHKTIGQGNIQESAPSPPRGPQNESNSDIMTTGTRDTPDAKSPIPVQIFVVSKVNPLYLDSTDVDTMASQIVGAKGFAGTNAEYVLGISHFIKKYIPEDDDRLLFDLDDKINQKNVQVDIMRSNC